MHILELFIAIIIILFRRAMKLEERHFNLFRNECLGNCYRGVIRNAMAINKKITHNNFLITYFDITGRFRRSPARSLARQLPSIPQLTTLTRKLTIIPEVERWKTRSNHQNTSILFKPIN